jgi:RNA-directed DNA polymerase
MTAEKATAGAVSHDLQGWYEQDFRKAEREVRRLQARIVQATQQGRWNKVKALQHLLTHSHSGRLLAVLRVTQNQGHKTPGVDGET